MHPAMSALFPVHKRRKQTSKIQHRVIEPWTTELRCTLCFWSVHQVGVAGQLPGPSSGLQSLAPSKSALLVIVNLPLPPFHAKRSGSRGTVLIAWGTSAMVEQCAVWCGKHLMLVSRSWNLFWLHYTCVGLSSIRCQIGWYWLDNLANSSKQPCEAETIQDSPWQQRETSLMLERWGEPLASLLNI